jgi:16S rRNA (cytosine1402-N4)-methyltransferase
MTSETVHIPILVEPIVQALIEPFKKLPDDAPPHWIVDCTLGGGGHTSEFLKALAMDPALQKHKVLSIDQDPAAVEAGHQRFAKEIAEGRLEIQHSRFSQATDFFEGKLIYGLMADLGFSSDQLENSERGLSFLADGPLDMRLDPTRGQSCRDYLLTVTQPELEKVLSEYGEERFSRRIAQVIIDKRREKQLPRTSRELADLIVRAVPPPARHGRIHAATRTFQALRIIVNEELNELDSLLSHVILEVKPGGRVAIISFHSLEDRRVKQVFKGQSRDEAAFEPLTKKPIEADEEELRRNPRSRSAKLRIAERLQK